MLHSEIPNFNDPFLSKTDLNCGGVTITTHLVQNSELGV